MSFSVTFTDGSERRAQACPGDVRRAYAPGQSPDIGGAENEVVLFDATATIGGRPGTPVGPRAAIQLVFLAAAVAVGL
ncbi:MAG TPA: hypothetical protein VM388_02200 [Acidimicrobiales bacterium]|jgi:hypothetical protein|nr:hypothetical protein [Acidimicrobiales bacterium]